MPLDDADHKPWEKLPTETDKQFHAFTHFMALLPHERSMAAAYTAHQKICRAKNPLKSLPASGEWQEWRFRFSWVERVASHDAMLAERDRLQRIHEIDLMNRRHTQISLALQNLLVERLQAVATTGETFKMTPVQMAALLDRASLVERRSRGEATSIVKHQGQPDAGAALDLSKLSDAELDIFQSLVQKAQPASQPAQLVPGEAPGTALIKHDPHGSNGQGE